MLVRGTQNLSLKIDDTLQHSQMNATRSFFLNQLLKHTNDWRRLCCSRCTTTCTSEVTTVLLFATATATSDAAASGGAMDTVASSGSGESSVHCHEHGATTTTGEVDARIRDATITDVTTRLFRVPLDQVCHARHDVMIEGCRSNRLPQTLQSPVEIRKVRRF